MAIPCFLSSIHGLLPLVQSLLPPHFRDFDDAIDEGERESYDFLDNDDWMIDLWPNKVMMKWPWSGWGSQGSLCIQINERLHAKGINDIVVGAKVEEV